MKFGSLSKYFPPPKFLKPVQIGISFSDHNIKAISFDKNLPDPGLKSVIMPIEKGAIVSGKISDTGEIVKQLSAVKEKFNSPFVFFTIPDELIYIFSASVPTGIGGNLSESIAFIMEENVPLSLNDIVFDFTPIKVTPSESGLNTSVVVAACAKKEIDRFVEVIYRAGLEPIGCIHESQAIAEAVAPKKTLEAFCVVHARKDRVGIYLVKKNIVHFSTLRSVSGGDYKKQLLDEYAKFSEYYSKYDNSGDQPIKAVLVCGEFEYAKEAVEAMSNTPEVPQNVKLSNVWANAFEMDKFLPSIPFEESLNLAGPIGAVLSDAN